MKKTILIICLCFSLVNTPSHSQLATESSHNLKTATQQKKQLTPKDYDLWESVSLKNISNNGEWVSYKINYTGNKDTLFLKNTNRNVVHRISGGFHGNFSAQSNYFAYIVRGKSNDLRYIDLKTGEQNQIQGAINYKFSASGHYLAVHMEKEERLEKAKRKSLLVINLTKGTSMEVKNVSEFSFNGRGNQLVYFAKNETSHFAALMYLENDKETQKVITSNPNNKYHYLIWNKAGNSFAFMEVFKDPKFKEQSHFVHHYRDGKLYSFDHRKSKTFPKGMRVNSEFLMSNDSQKLFFGIVPWSLEEQEEISTKSENSSDVQIGHWKDKEIYTRNHFKGIYAKKSKLSVWSPTTDVFRQIANIEHPETVLTGDSKHALTFHPQQYRPKFKYVEDYIDIYITNLKTREKELFLEKQLYSFYHTLCSPEGHYISYFKDKHWWVYNIKNKTHTNITKNLPHPTGSLKHSRFPQPYGNPGWTKKDDAILIYDEFDIWLISPDGALQKKLTNGRVSKTQHRIRERIYPNRITIIDSFNLNEGLLLSTYGEITKRSGYSTWSTGKGVEKLMYADKHIDQLKKAKNKNIYVVREQRFDAPPKLMFYSKKENIKKKIVQSNPQHWDFSWGRSQLIQYPGINKDTLQGALFYPANYQTGKKYPMIVYIYQKLSQKLHRYNNPSLYSSIGFNPTVYMTNGYFVLMPDITYEYNEPGTSATKCVVSAVEQVLEMGLVDKNKIGLLGHSFGGYETSSIITQTDIFSAAVAGAAPVDLVNWYLSFRKDNTMEPRLNYFESGQPQFTGSFYQLPDEYLRNSPIHNLQNITTPLLSWFGKNDANVDFSQGVEMYNAMRRIEKEHVFLVYPNDGHTLFKNKKNQVDLSEKTLHWFDYKLKEKKPESWVLKGSGE